MPMILTEAKPFLRKRGVTIYPVHADDNLQKKRIPHLFSMNPFNMGATERTALEFDVRDLPTWQKYASAKHLDDFEKSLHTIQDAIEDGYIDKNGVRSKPLKYNHMFSLSFTVVTDHEGENVTSEELETGLRYRLEKLTCGRYEDLREACQLPCDTYENE